MGNKWKPLQELDGCVIPGVFVRHTVDKDQIGLVRSCNEDGFDNVSSYQIEWLSKDSVVRTSSRASSLDLLVSSQSSKRSSSSSMSCSSCIVSLPQSEFSSFEALDYCHCETYKKSPHQFP